jgi:hypothetical protein
MTTSIFLTYDVLVSIPVMNLTKVLTEIASY